MVLEDQTSRLSRLRPIRVATPTGSGAIETGATTYLPEFPRSTSKRTGYRSDFGDLRSQRELLKEESENGQQNRPRFRCGNFWIARPRSRPRAEPCEGAAVPAASTASLPCPSALAGDRARGGRYFGGLARPTSRPDLPIQRRRPAAPGALPRLSTPYPLPSGQLLRPRVDRAHP